MKNTPCCGNCYFWCQVAEGSKDCRCHAAPPQALVVGMTMQQNVKLQGIPQQAPQPVIGSSFPPIATFGWCGCHRLLETEKPDDS